MELLRPLPSTEVASNRILREAIAKGDLLVERMMALPLDLVESTFQSVHGRGDLQKWGYVRARAKPVCHKDTTHCAVGQTLSDPIIVRDFHKNHVTVDGIRYLPTQARYENWCNPLEGVLIAHDNFGPEHTQRRSGNPPVGFPLPELKYWSDVAYLQWAEASLKYPNAPGLKYIIQSSVRNHNSNLIINRILRDEGKKGVRWPGVMYNMDTEQARAILGCPNGYGIAHLLSQHKRGLRHKTVSQIRIFYGRGLGGICDWPYLVFHVQDVEPSSLEQNEVLEKGSVEEMSLSKL